ncbi:hypothetical protein [Staphylococcus phage Stab22]|nr:hypothetical protein [Staphylococcus phage Stab22]
MRIYISNDYNEKLLDKCLRDIRETKKSITYSMNYGEKDIKEADIEVIHLDKNMLETERRAFAYSKFTGDCICLFPYKVILIREGKLVFNFKWEELI